MIGPQATGYACLTTSLTAEMQRGEQSPGSSADHFVLVAHGTLYGTSHAGYWPKYGGFTGTLADLWNKGFAKIYLESLIVCCVNIAVIQTFP